VFDQHCLHPKCPHLRTSTHNSPFSSLRDPSHDGHSDGGSMAHGWRAHDPQTWEQGLHGSQQNEHRVMSPEVMYGMLETILWYPQRRGSNHSRNVPRHHLFQSPQVNFFLMTGFYHQRRRFCVHGSRMTFCPKCGGGSICKHGIRKTYCLECGGGSMCKHMKRRSRCVDCAGKPLACHHGKPKSTCYECSLKCKHLRPLRKCPTCIELFTCKHDRLMFHCRECRLESTELTCEHVIPDPNCHICWFIGTFGSV
jgi:hypothetical protein